jgi:uncharacterized membrane protein YeaQ/YmgE (transglycosylase-associated protein family)
MRGAFEREEFSMFSFWAVVYLLCVGVVAGYLARLLVPGRDSMGFWWTLLLGIVGSFAGGFLAWALFGWDSDEGALQPGGVVFSILGAVLALLVWRAIDRRRTARP